MAGSNLNMKRRNIECGKIRRPVKKAKLCDGVYGSLFLYTKFLLVWVMVLMADFLLEFRFEYLWPVWLLLHSLFDSFRYQGFVLSLLFLFISIMADVMCYIFVPVQWLYFAASTYVWVQYVWHSDRGLCLQTVSLWFLCVYIEMSLRLKDFRCLPMFQYDLCRPFAAHCIGYPVITLGIGCKTYLAFKLRTRKQKGVQKTNAFYAELLQQALPVEQVEQSTPSIESFDKRKPGYQPDSDCYVNAGAQNISYCYNSSNVTGSFDDADSNFETNSTVKDVNDFRDAEQHQNNSKVVYKTTVAAATKNCLSSNTAKSDNLTTASTLKQMFSNNRDDVINRLKSELKRAKADLQACRLSEQELRCQLHNVTTNERATKAEIDQLRHDNDSLQSKLHNLVATRQQEKQSLAAVDRKFQDERKLRISLEQQLAAERKKKTEEMANKSGECADVCRSRFSELEVELSQKSWQLKCREEQLLQCQAEIQLLRQFKESHQDNEMLVNAFLAVQEKNAQLESSLSSETRLKMDLFSALGETKRQIELQHTLLLQKEAVIAELKAKIAEVMALVPATGFSTLCSLPASAFSPALSESTRILSGSPSQSLVISQSTLNPGATDYQPRLSK